MTDALSVPNILPMSIDQLTAEEREAARYAERLAQVTPQDASAAARDLVDPDKATVVIVGNAAEFIDGVRAIRPDVEVIPAASLDLSSADMGLE